MGVSQSAARNCWGSVHISRDSAGNYDLFSSSRDHNLFGGSGDHNLFSGSGDHELVIAAPVSRSESRKCLPEFGKS